MYKEDVLAYATVGLIVVICLACIVGIGYAAGRITCDAQTKDIGFNHYYNWIGGCMIEPKPGQWVPLNNYRLIEP